MSYCMTNKLSGIANKDQKSCNNKKLLFRNHLQNLSAVPKTCKIPDNMSTSVVFGMRAVRMIFLLF